MNAPFDRRTLGHQDFMPGPPAQACGLTASTCSSPRLRRTLAHKTQRLTRAELPLRSIILLKLKGD
jgi:hypothetical protein